MAPKSKSGKWYAANKAGRDKKNRKQRAMHQGADRAKAVDGIRATRKHGKAGKGKEWGHPNGKAGKVVRQSKKSNRADTSTGGRRKGVKHAGHNKGNPKTWGKRKSSSLRRKR
jgi:hypothetical protein